MSMLIDCRRVNHIIRSCTRRDKLRICSRVTRTIHPWEWINNQPRIRVHNSKVMDHRALTCGQSSVLIRGHTDWCMMVWTEESSSLHKDKHHTQTLFIDTTKQATDLYNCITSADVEEYHTCSWLVTNNLFAHTYYWEIGRAKSHISYTLYAPLAVSSMY